jgi:release factor glutamine methyltransferase
MGRKFVHMTVQEATFFLLKKLRAIYPESESSQITDWVMEYLTGSQKTERMMYKNATITEGEVEKLRQFTNRLLHHEPVQYILNEAWFCGLKFYVDRNVLIPRPETEELVEWIISNCKFPVDELNILDIGSGSGCISIALKRRLRKAVVEGIDISEEALDVARKNATSLGTDVNFIQMDFLEPGNWNKLPKVDILVSNPPYIPQENKSQMRPNVVNFEPGTALFVPDEDPLVFYKAIAEFGKSNLKDGGAAYLEIHEELGPSTVTLFQSHDYTTELKKDMQGKDRMLKAVRG